MSSPQSLLFSPFKSKKLFFRAYYNGAIQFDKWVHVKKGQCIVILEPNDLTAESIYTSLSYVAPWWPSWLSPERTAVIAAVRTPACQELEWTRYQLASHSLQQELEVTGKIKGHIALIGTEVVWVSQFDLNMLTKLQGQDITKPTYKQRKTLSWPLS